MEGIMPAWWSTKVIAGRAQDGRKIKSNIIICIKPDAWDRGLKIFWSNYDWFEGQLTTDQIETHQSLYQAYGREKRPPTQHKTCHFTFSSISIIGVA